ncbi:Bax inhibitor-1/YccA family protein [Streptomyces nymphaeiformis]|uniref:Putative YccA/Bax inhibitor family protein n=1 Tax=Streptomyces nymphaeiformis TaxID=2663842 RepID=A0A7W7TX81_9ACTN|nr:Bax inhibitor-1/YccA family protein [Streptomyces nymphaeiformis]MBB4981054.1 putative YccA/Bax inhibitor family protein [Streptomyces nymphaeiformis]
MRSSNPVFSRRGFRRDDGADRFTARQPQPTLAGEALTNPYADPHPGPAEGNSEADGRAADPAMTIDDVVVRTAATLGTVVLTATLSWLLLPVDSTGIGRSYGIGVAAALVAFALSMVQAFRRAPSPALILGYAAFEGVFLGVVSSAASAWISPGVVIQAVLGTMAVSAGVLIAYKRRWIRVTRRFHGFVIAAATGFLILLAADALFSLFGADGGLGFSSGGLGIAFGLIGIALGAAFLALDFKQVEDALTYGAPRQDSWLAAFGLVTTLVWIYLEALRVLSILQSDN